MGQSYVKLSSLDFEIAAVLFNAATLAMQCGVQAQAQKQKETLSKAKTFFLRAAGLYAAANDKVKKVQGAVSVDMGAGLEMLKMLSLAHAQRCIYEYAATQENQKSLWSKLAAATADYYEEVESHIRTKSLPMGKLLNAANQYKKWSSKIMINMLYFRALANQKDAVICKPNRVTKMGIEIVRLEKARDMLKVAVNKAEAVPGTIEVVRGLLEEVEAHLKEATTQNNAISYINEGEIEKLRTTSPPEAIHGKTLVEDKEVPLQNQMNEAVSAGLFRFIVPSDLRRRAETAREERAGLVKDLLQRMDEDSEEAWKFLRTVSPQLEAQRARLTDSGAKLSAGLRQQIEVLQRYMGKQAGAQLGDVLWERYKESERSRVEMGKTLVQLKQDLEEQRKLDDEMKTLSDDEGAKFKWQPVGKNEVYTELMKIKVDLEKRMKDGMVGGDAKTAQRLHDGKEAMRALSQPLASIEAEISGQGQGGGADGAAGQLATLITKMSDAIENAEANLQARHMGTPAQAQGALKGELECLRDDAAAAEFIYGEMQGGAQESAAIEKYFAVYAIAEEKVTASMQELVGLLSQVKGSEDDLTSSNLKLVSAGVTECEEKLKSLAASVDTCNAIVEAIREGAVFYAAMHDPIERYKSRVQSFTAARNLHAGDAKAELKRKKEDQERIDQEIKKREAEMQETERKKQEAEEAAQEAARRLAASGSASVVHLSRVAKTRVRPKPPKPPRPPEPDVPPPPPPGDVRPPVNVQVPTMCRPPKPPAEVASPAARISGVKVGAELLPIPDPDHFDFHFFISHAWGGPPHFEGHERATLLNAHLQEKGYKTWFDAEQLTGEMHSKVLDGIEKSFITLVCVTRTYLDKIASEDPMDHCKMEFMHARRMRKAPFMLAVVFEDEMRRQDLWYGSVGATLGDTLYVALTSDSDSALREASQSIDIEYAKRANHYHPFSPHPIASPAAPGLPGLIWGDADSAKDGGLQKKRPPAIKPDTSQDEAFARALLAQDVENNRVDTSQDESLARQLMQAMGTPNRDPPGQPNPAHSVQADEAYAR